jgi:ribosome-associated translation inhibitor RaiA
MKTNLHINDNSCRQLPDIHEFAVKQMAPIVKKDPRIRNIHLEFSQTPRSSGPVIYKIKAVATGRGPTFSAQTRDRSVRAALKSLKLKMSRRLVRQTTRCSLDSIGIQQKA